MYTVLFVCTGNTCRSPMAELIMKQQLHSLALATEIEVQSAGLSANEGEVLSEGANIALLYRNLTDGQKHRAKRLTPEQVAKADLILTMTEMHKQMLLQDFPGNENKVYTLREYGTSSDVSRNLEEWLRVKPNVPIREAVNSDSMDIEDPYGCSLETYELTAEQIERSCLDVLMRLQRELGNT